MLTEAYNNDLHSLLPRGSPILSVAPILCSPSDPLLAVKLAAPLEDIFSWRSIPVVAGLDL